MSHRFTDLGLLVVLVTAAALALLVPAVPWQVAGVLGFLLLLILPGYAVVAALFPKRPDSPTDGNNPPDWPARFGLSLVSSAIVVAVVGVLLASPGWYRLRIMPAVLLIGSVTLLAVGVAVVRRVLLPVDQRADAVAGLSVGAVTDSFGTSGTQSVLLIVSVVVLTSALAFAATAPTNEPYSEVYLTGGEDVDIGPENATLVAGADNTMALTISNHEGESTDYQVVVRLQRVGANGTIQELERLDDFEVRLAPTKTLVAERSLDPSMSGERLRLQVLIYKGGVKTDPGPGTADLTLRRWVTVIDGEAA